MNSEDVERLVAPNLNGAATKFRNFLWSQGFPVTKEEGNWTAFNYEGGKYIIEISNVDADYIRLIYPWFYSCPFEASSAAIHAANQVNIKTKICKITYSNRRKTGMEGCDVTFDITFESFISVDSAEFPLRFMRYLKMIRATRDSFMDFIK